MLRHYHVLSDINEPYMQINVHERRDNYNLMQHSHDFYQLIFVTSGKLTVTTEGDENVLGAGMLHILPPHEYHALSSTGYCQLGMDVAMSHPHLDIFYETFTRPATLIVPELSDYVRKLMDMTYDDRLSIEMGRALCSLILLGASKAARSRDTVPLKGRIIEYINSHLGSSTTLEEIANALFISPSHLERMSNVFFGTGVIALYNRKRFESACAYLVGTSLSVRAIGELLGFGEASNFSAFFKRYAGCSPAEYRRRFMA